MEQSEHTSSPAVVYTLSVTSHRTAEVRSLFYPEAPIHLIDLKSGN